MQEVLRHVEVWHAQWCVLKGGQEFVVHEGHRPSPLDEGIGELVASEHAKKQEFRDKFAENYDKAKALEQAKVQGAKRARATVSKEQAVAAKQLF